VLLARLRGSLDFSHASHASLRVGNPFKGVLSTVMTAVAGSAVQELALRPPCRKITGLPEGLPLSSK